MDDRTEEDPFSTSISRWQANTARYHGRSMAMRIHRDGRSSKPFLLQTCRRVVGSSRRLLLRSRWIEFESSHRTVTSGKSLVRLATSATE